MSITIMVQKIFWETVHIYFCFQGILCNHAIEKWYEMDIIIIEWLLHYGLNAANVDASNNNTGYMSRKRLNIQCMRPIQMMGLVTMQRSNRLTVQVRMMGCP